MHSIWRERTPVPKTADIIATALYEEGVRYAYGIPGGEVLELLEAFRKVGIKFILTKQEMGAGIMADATYQLTGKPGVLVATLGPGITNTTTAVAQASLDRSAVIVLTGEIATSLKSIYTHQIIDQESLLRPIVKWTTTIAAKNAFDQVRKGIAIARQSMPGPVHFNVPTDVAAAEQPESKRFAPVGVRTLPRRDDRGPIEALLKKARRPLALVGVGVQSANSSVSSKRGASRSSAHTRPKASCRKIIRCARARPVCRRWSTSCTWRRCAKPT